MNGARISRVVQALPLRRGAIELLLLVALGLFMAVLGPYRTLDVAPVPRTLYWLLSIVGGGLIGIALDLTLGPRIGGFWRRVALVTVAMTPPVTLLVYLLNLWLFDSPPGIRWLPILAWQVFVIAFLVMGMRALAWRKVVGQAADRAADRGRSRRPLRPCAHRRRLGARRDALCRCAGRAGAGARIPAASIAESI